jgi:hypothetical protein
METQTYIQNAYERLKNLPNPNMKDHLNKFICDCVGLLPAKYGPMIQNKIIKELGVIKVKSESERGDFRKNKTFFEFKCSFLSKGKSYSITNIRNWHNFNFYVLCFIDVSDNFTPRFYVIDKGDITKFKLRGMNGTYESNTKNENVGMRVTIQKNSEEMNLIDSMNKLEDNSFSSLYDFVSSFKMKKTEPKDCKFTFNGNNFSDDKVTTNYINFLKLFITNYGHIEVEKSLGCCFSTDLKKLSACVKNSNQYEKLLDKFYVSTYTSTSKKIIHMKKICQNNPESHKLEFK